MKKGKLIMRISGFTPPVIRPAVKAPVRFGGDEFVSKALDFAKDNAGDIAGGVTSSLFPRPKTIAERKHREAQAHYDSVVSNASSSHSARMKAKAERDRRATEAERSGKIAKNIGKTGALLGAGAGYGFGDHTGITSAVVGAAVKPAGTFVANVHHVGTSSDYKKKTAGDTFVEGLNTPCTIM